jgi:hypothetical protein
MDAALRNVSHHDGQVANAARALNGGRHNARQHERMITKAAITARCRIAGRAPVPAITGRALVIW